jgi:aspartate aminotransferase
MTVTASRRIDRLAAAMAPVLDLLELPYFERAGDPDIADFVFGNPHEMPLPGLVESLQRQVVPQDKNWFAYKMSEPGPRRVVAESLARRTGQPWEPDDVLMTNAGFGALAVTLRAITEPGDEVIFLSPPWFFYEAMIVAAEADAVRVHLAPPRFDIDVDAIAAAITPRTRGVIVNSPHNPSGRVYTLDELRPLAEVLEAASRRQGRPVYLVSDEPYNRLVFDGRTYHSPSEVYPNTIVTYSYGKVLLAPGQRIGYIAIPPTMADREPLRRALFMCQLVNGWSFPNALLQHAIEDLEGLSIDVGHLQAKRDRMVAGLREIGYETTFPEGTFYVMVRSPIADDLAFTEMLGRHDTFVLPGTIVELPGWVRISLTANDAMIERGLRGFAAAWAEARG